MVRASLMPPNCGENPMRMLILSAPLLFAAACSPEADSSNATVDINAAATQAQGAVDAYGANAASDAPVEIGEPDTAANTESDKNTLAPLDPPAPGTPGGLPDDRTPISEAPFTPDSAQGAADVVQTYYALIGEGKYTAAFALREPNPATSATAADFTKAFARYSEYHANVGAPGAIDAGAGQRFVTVPVQIYARAKLGQTPVYQIGSVTLHRTGVDGASAEQQTWRIRSIDLKTASKR